MNIETTDFTLIYLLGYLTSEQWLDALQDKDLDKVITEELLHQVDNLYKGIERGVDDLTKEKVIGRLRG